MHTYRWDLDRTYLETEIHSTVGLLKAAVESASQKRTVPGAAPLVRGLLAHTPGNELFVLSGSPRQMHRVLQAKLHLDGVYPTRMVLKNNLGNLMRGRFSAIRNQLAYKLPELLRDRGDQPSARLETLFGDDSEVDAVIYAVYAELVAGRMDEAEMVSLLRDEGAFPDNIERAVHALGRVEPADVVDAIYIRLDRGVPTHLFATHLGTRVHAVFSWWQAAVALTAGDLLSTDALAEVTEACGLNHHPAQAAGLAQDAVRRGIVTRDQTLAVVNEACDTPVVTTVQRAMRRLGSWRLPKSQHLDYRGFLAAVQRLGT